jgi:large subunit ribosomal protein L17
MKHRKKGRKFGRQRDQRKALLKSLAANLILKEKITTTEAKAKELRPFVEKIITKSKSAKGKNNLAVVRYLAGYLPVKARQKIIKEIGPRYQSRPGGYTRIIKKGLRQRDGAKMAIIELVK